MAGYHFTMNRISPIGVDSSSARLLCVLLIGVFTPSGQTVMAATSTAVVSANIVSTITITNQTGMIFGDLSSSNSSGTITISPDGTRSETGGASINSATSGGPATFEVTGDANGVYSITLPTSVTINSGGGYSMIVDSFTSNPSVNGSLDASGRQTLLVGSTLNVGVLQPFGSYTGVMAVTVDYN